MFRFKKPISLLRYRKLRKKYRFYFLLFPRSPLSQSIVNWIGEFEPSRLVEIVPDSFHDFVIHHYGD